MSVVSPPPTSEAANSAVEPGAPPPHPTGDEWWPTVIAVVLVLGCTTALLFTGHSLYDALLAAGGMALAGNQVARRVTADAGPLPTVIVGSAVTAFGAVLLTTGYSFAEAAMGAGIGGLVAGEMAGRMFGAVRRPWRGV